MYYIMKQIVIPFLFLLVAATLAAQEKTFPFTLKVANNSAFTSYCYIPGNEKMDSIMAGQAKQIVFDQPIDQPAFYLAFYTTDTAVSSYRQKLVRILNTKEIRNVDIDKRNRLQFALTGPEKILNDYNPKLRSKNFWKLDSIILRNSNSIAAADIIYLSICDSDVPVDTIKYYRKMLSPQVLASPFGQRIKRYLEARDRLTIGSIFPSFSLPDSSDHSISLTSIKSKFILVDFWFSRCTPCVRSFPEIRNLYDSSTREQLEIVGISVDGKPDNKLWKATIGKHHLNWINLNDNKSNLTNGQLAIVNFPTRVLLDRNHKIIFLDTNNSDEEFFSKVKDLVNR
jgi:peroxiredoxin